MKTTLLDDVQNTDQNDVHDIIEEADDSNIMLRMRQMTL